MYRNAKRKLSEYDPGNAGMTSTPDGTPANTPKKTPNKRKSVPNTPKGGNDGDGDGVHDEEASPSKQKQQRSNSVKQEVTVKKSRYEIAWRWFDFSFILNRLGLIVCMVLQR